MSDFVNYLQHRIEETKRDLAEAEARMRQAGEDRTMFNAELQGYEQTLAAEMRRQGLPAALSVSVQDKLELSDSVNAESVVNKAEFARQFVRKHGESGVTPNDIFTGFRGAGIPIKKPYIYALVQRLQKQEAIKSRRGRWYPVLPEQSVNGTERVLLP